MRCRENGIEHRLTKIKHPWTNGQVERMNRTIREATVKRYHYDSHRQLQSHLTDFIGAYPPLLHQPKPHLFVAGSVAGSRFNLPAIRPITIPPTGASENRHREERMGAKVREFEQTARNDRGNRPKAARQVWSTAHRSRGATIMIPFPSRSADCNRRVFRYVSI